MAKNYLDPRDILTAEDFLYADVDCPEWGGVVHVRGLSAGEQSSISKKVKDGNQLDLEVTIVTMGCVDADGNRIFRKEDKDALKKKSNSVITRLARKILELSGGSDEDLAETQKNSGQTTSEGSF